MCDLFSRYYLACRAQPNQQFAGTLRTFRKIMRLHGCPRSSGDNGTPFASLAFGLSALSVWWINRASSSSSSNRLHRNKTVLTNALTAI
ncbi:MAG: hypothetical protein HS122_16215 [Opitutaceae bacterium]|nr:hypothetical protein [Opitutaceae bacterium]